MHRPAHIRVRRRGRPFALLVALLAAALSLTVLPAAQAQPPAPAAAPGGGDRAAAQLLTWTAGDDITAYASAPARAVAGEATLVFENSAATGNTTGMPHTLTFTTSDPDYNSDVSVNILADPGDANGGRHEVTVDLSPGVYHYYCAIPGHGQMQGELVVTGGGEDTTPPEATADVDGEQNADGDYLGGATVTLDATDDSSGVDRVDYAVDGAGWTAYEAPVLVDAPGEHTVRYRATDKAGNVSQERSVTFTVVGPPPGDTTPPEVTATVDGEQNADGDYLAMATLSLRAQDEDSGVAGVEYAVGGGAFGPYTEPVMFHAEGEHTVAYRATDHAGNTSQTSTVTFTVVGDDGGEPDPGCPERDDRPLVVVGAEASGFTGVPNREAPGGCTVNELIEDEAHWDGRKAFRTHVRGVLAQLRENGVIDREERAAIMEAARRSGVGHEGAHGYRALLDGSRESFERWEHVGGGAFTRNSDGSITSSGSVPGMGMLWFPEQPYGDFSLKLQFRDDAPGDRNANSGVFVRFPGVHDHPEEPRPEWVAIRYGHEVQINDAAGGDQYKTGSVYGFDVVTRGESNVMPKGVWNDYEVRVVGRHWTVYRNGRLINAFENAPGQLFSPPRGDDPGTDGRQHPTGHLGLQTHGTSDVVTFRDIRVQPL
ncbi:family 16 glycoside hydrolase [Streptomyces sp. DSM 42041]|uniref:Family 16 glycoside hydrolase n=1 Tax=Streptomyces hazeniae TaxID=3075538 RepID=A0ABU2NTS3_9ACTN|nr:family 16 glycoside hydrolase [Streptomyces sp. DSM 42041]MDT0380125.1 family 16 glycoside hydrolase [Streptomyces sp. DSM 42041]